MGLRPVVMTTMEARPTKLAGEAAAGAQPATAEYDRQQVRERPHQYLCDETREQPRHQLPDPPGHGRHIPHSATGR